MPQKYQNNSYEELLSLLNEKEVYDPFIKNKTEVSFFLSSFNILKGKNFLKIKLLHKLYTYWSKEPLDLKQFRIELENLGMINSKAKVCINLTHSNITENLLKTLDKDNKIISDVRYQKHFDTFIEYYSMKPGDKKIDETDLEYLYTKWIQYSSNKKLSNEKLKNALSINFKKITTKNGNMYFMNNTINNIIKQEKMLDVVVNEKNKTK